MMSYTNWIKWMDGEDVELSLIDKACILLFGTFALLFCWAFVIVVTILGDF